VVANEGSVTATSERLVRSYVIEQHYGVEVIGRVPEEQVAYYAVTTQRRIQHPGIVAIIEAARSGVLEWTVGSRYAEGGPTTFLVR
jgi:hypothetical protein